MEIRKIVVALAALPKEQVEKIVKAADASRAAEAALSTLEPTPVKRRQRKAKVEETAIPTAEPARRGRPRKGATAENPLSSAIERLKAVKAGGTKIRRVVEPDDED